MTSNLATLCEGVCSAYGRYFRVYSCFPHHYHYNKKANTRRREKCLHLEVNVLRPDKMKTHLEAVVNNQERGGGKLKF